MQQHSNNNKTQQHHNNSNRQHQQTKLQIEQQSQFPFQDIENQQQQHKHFPYLNSNYSSNNPTFSHLPAAEGGFQGFNIRNEKQRNKDKDKERFENSGINIKSLKSKPTNTSIISKIAESFTNNNNPNTNNNKNNKSTSTELENIDESYEYYQVNKGIAGGFGNGISSNSQLMMRPRNPIFGPQPVNSQHINSQHISSPQHRASSISEHRQFSPNHNHGVSSNSSININNRPISPSRPLPVIFSTNPQQPSPIKRSYSPSQFQPQQQVQSQPIRHAPSIHILEASPPKSPPHSPPHSPPLSPPHVHNPHMSSFEAQPQSRITQQPHHQNGASSSQKIGILRLGGEPSSHKNHSIHNNPQNIPNQQQQNNLLSPPSRLNQATSSTSSLSSLQISPRSSYLPSPLQANNAQTTFMNQLSTSNIIGNGNGNGNTNSNIIYHQQQQQSQHLQNNLINSNFHLQQQQNHQQQQQQQQMVYISKRQHQQLLSIKMMMNNNSNNNRNNIHYQQQHHQQHHQHQHQQSLNSSQHSNNNQQHSVNNSINHNTTTTLELQRLRQQNNKLTERIRVLQASSLSNLNNLHQNSSTALKQQQEHFQKQNQLLRKRYQELIMKYQDSLTKECMLLLDRCRLEMKHQHHSSSVNIVSTRNID